MCPRPVRKISQVGWELGQALRRENESHAELATFGDEPTKAASREPMSLVHVTGDEGGFCPAAVDDAVSDRRQEKMPDQISLAQRQPGETDDDRLPGEHSLGGIDATPGRGEYAPNVPADERMELRGHPPADIGPFARRRDQIRQRG